MSKKHLFWENHEKCGRNLHFSVKNAGFTVKNCDFLNFLLKFIKDRKSGGH